MSNVKCQFCGSPVEQTFCDLGMSPVSNAYLHALDLQNMEPFYPLHAQVCGSCFLVQLQEFESPSKIFDGEYAYFSSYSESWLRHAKRYSDEMIARFGLTEASQVVEVASNDGYLLQYFHQQNIPVLGIEPAANCAGAALEKGVPSWVKFFGVKTAKELAAGGKQADLLLGNNVLAHVPNLNDFVGGMPLALKSTGVITMEFPHLLNLIKLNQFDTIYHEHFSYLSLCTVKKIFNTHDLEIFDVEELPTHGGSLRIYAKHTNCDLYEVNERVNYVLNAESAAGLTNLATYASFSHKVEDVKRKLLKFLCAAKEQGKTIVAYGAAAKGNTLLNYCGIRSDFIDFVVDVSPHKQGKFLPGTHIPILSPEALIEKRPDYVLILPWNISHEIVEQMAEIREWGGQFVVPIPEVRIL